MKRMTAGAVEFHFGLARAVAVAIQTACQPGNQNVGADFGKLGGVAARTGLVAFGRAGTRRQMRDMIEPRRRIPIRH